MLIKWWREHCRQLGCEPEELFSVPNGMFTTHAMANKCRAEGLVAGVADLCLAVPSHDGRWSVLWLEMKRLSGGEWHDEQKQFASRVMARGQQYVLCRGAVEAIFAIQAHLRGEVGCDLSTD